MASKNAQSENVSFTVEEINTFHGNDIKKQKKIIQQKLKKFNGVNITQFLWECIAVLQTNQKKKDKVLSVYKRPKDDSDDDKNDSKESEQKTLSVLIDFKRGKKYGGMCPKGDTYFNHTKGACMECGSNENVQSCCDCWGRDQLMYKACDKCLLINLQNLENEQKFDTIKRNVIRQELLTKPSLSVDLLCALPRKMALTKIMNDLLELEETNRRFYSMFLIDIDNLKALNSTLSHEGADEVIKNVGAVLNKWTEKVNNGEVDGLQKCYPFRQGGDEYALIVKTNVSAYRASFSNFYNGWKKEINDIANKSFMDKYTISENGLAKGILTLKERKKKKLLSVIDGIDMDENSKKKYYKIMEMAIDNENTKFNVDKIGVSVGLFVPKLYSKEMHWIECAEKAQDIAKEMKGKNQIRIYYEDINDIVPANRTDQCLRKGCHTPVAKHYLVD